MRERRERYLSLFSGAGYGDLGLQQLAGLSCMGYVEVDEHCQRVLARRQKEGHLDAAPIFGHITAFTSYGYARRYRGLVEGVVGGPPCQFISAAARGRNCAPNLWGDMRNVVREVEPRWVLVENVGRFKQVVPAVTADLEGLGYRVRPPIEVDAAAVGAPHSRTRVWLFAHADDARDGDGALDAEVAGAPEPPALPRADWWDVLPGPCGLAHGRAGRMERYRASGNGQVPAVAAAALHLLRGER